MMNFFNPFPGEGVSSLRPRMQQGQDYYLQQSQQYHAQMLQGAGYSNYSGYPTTGGRHITKKDLIDYLRTCYAASDLVQVDEFETQRTRHVCPMGTQIWLLDKICQPVMTASGQIYVELFFCQNCRKLIINKSSLEIL